MSDLDRIGNPLEVTIGKLNRNGCPTYITSLGGVLIFHCTLAEDPRSYVIEYLRRATRNNKFVIERMDNFRDISYQELDTIKKGIKYSKHNLCEICT